MFSPTTLDPAPQSPPTNHKARPQAIHTSSEVEASGCKLMMIIVIIVMTKSHAWTRLSCCWARPLISTFPLSLREPHAIDATCISSSVAPSIGHPNRNQLAQILTYDPKPLPESWSKRKTQTASMKCWMVILMWASTRLYSNVGDTRVTLTWEVCGRAQLSMQIRECWNKLDSIECCLTKP